MRLSILEIFLLEMIFYALLWLWNDYVASYMCIIIPVIVLAVLLISVIVELIEPSRISRQYFVIMAVSAIVPVITGLAFYFIFGGNLEWLEGI